MSRSPSTAITAVISAVISALGLAAGLCLILANSSTLVAQCAALGTFTYRGNLPSGLQPPGTGEEVSGLAASRKNPGVLWAHDDKGNGTYLLALRENGALAQQYELKTASNVDWEDIAIGPGPVPGLPYIYIGDFGDNTASRSDAVIWRLSEPDVPATPTATTPLSLVESFRFTYPGGARDAEALFVDPYDGTPYVLSKENGQQGMLWRYPMPLDSKKTKVLVLESSFRHANPSFSAADISPDGRRIFFRNRDAIFWFRRSYGQTLAAAFAGTWCGVLATNQGNAESLAVAADGSSLFVVSEGRAEPLRQTKLILPPFGPTTIPTAFAFGSGWRGLFSTPHVAATAPILGKSRLRFSGYGFNPAAIAVLVLSGTRLDDGKVKLGNGWLHALPDIVLPTVTDGLGRTRIDFGVIPDAAGLRGLALFGQMVSPDAFTPGGFALTRGLEIHFDR